MYSFSELLLNAEKYIEKPVFIEYCIDDLPKWSEGFAVQQRAVISGGFKYVYYEGFEDQLFNLQDDEYELNNLIDDPDYAEVEKSLKNLIFKDWNPSEIAAIIQKRRANKKLLQSWALNTKPNEPFRGELNAAQNQLDIS